MLFCVFVGRVLRVGLDFGDSCSFGCLGLGCFGGLLQGGCVGLVVGALFLLAFCCLVIFVSIWYVWV